MRRQAGAPLFYFYKERLGTGSPPHPTRLRRPTYGLWWLRLDLTEQSPGLFDPQGEGFGGDEPDLETFFHKHAFQHIFPRKCVPNRSWHTGGNSPTIVPKTTIPKTSERERAGHKPGVQGLAPGVLSPDFLQRKSGSPAGVGGARGRCAPRPRNSPDHPQGTQYRRP